MSDKPCKTHRQDLFGHQGIFNYIKKKSGFLVFLEKLGNLMTSGPTFLHDISCLELGVAVSFRWGMSPLDMTPHLCYLHGPASLLMTLTQRNLRRWGNMIKGQLNAVCVCTCAVGRKTQSAPCLGFIWLGQSLLPPHAAHSLPRLCSVPCLEVQRAK